MKAIVRKFYWLCSGCDAVFEDKRDMVPRNSPGFRCPRCGMLCKRQHIANAADHAQGKATQ